MIIQSLCSSNGPEDEEIPSGGWRGPENPESLMDEEQEIQLRNRLIELDNRPWLTLEEINQRRRIIRFLEDNNRHWENS